MAEAPTPVRPQFVPEAVNQPRQEPLPAQLWQQASGLATTLPAHEVRDDRRRPEMMRPVATWRHMSARATGPADERGGGGGDFLGGGGEGLGLGEGGGGEGKGLGEGDERGGGECLSSGDAGDDVCAGLDSSSLGDGIGLRETGDQVSSTSHESSSGPSASTSGVSGGLAASRGGGYCVFLMRSGGGGRTVGGKGGDWRGGGICGRAPEALSVMYTKSCEEGIETAPY